MMETINLEWLNKLQLLDPTTKVDKNIFDISGYPNWENVNSNLLAFYLDEKEEHRLKRLFFDSLFEALIDNLPKTEKGQLINKLDTTLFEDTAYGVTRETNKIDILLISNEGTDTEKLWAVLIENKINHILNNDLKKYWESISAKNKIGIVLSKHPVVNNLSFETDGIKIEFTNITHEQLIKKVQYNLGNYFYEANDRHLFLLKEYISNIKSHYQMEQPNLTLEQNLKSIQKNKEKILELEKAVYDARYYVLQRTWRALEKYNFKPNSYYLAVDKHFYCTENEEKLPLRIYIHINELAYNNIFAPVMELYDEYCGIADNVVSQLDTKGAYAKFPNLNRDVDKGSGWAHIGQIATAIRNDKNDLAAALDSALAPFFEKGENEQSFYELALGIVRKDLNK